MLDALKIRLLKAKGAVLASEAVWVGALDIQNLLGHEGSFELSWPFSLLDQKEQEKSRKYRFFEDRLRFVMGRTLVKTALASLLNLSPQEISLECDTHGKPFVKAPPEAFGFFFSISHSAHLVAVALTHGRQVGIDIEPWNRSVDIEAISQRFLSPQERLAISQARGREREAFLRTWTLKEAYAKARGLGLGLSFQDFGLVIGPDQAVTWAPGPPDQGSWQFSSGSLGPDFCLGLCVQGYEQENLECTEAGVFHFAACLYSRIDKGAFQIPQKALQSAKPCWKKRASIKNLRQKTSHQEGILRGLFSQTIQFRLDSF